MELATLIEKLDTMKNGTFRRLTYKTELPVKSAFKKDITIEKITGITVRFGIDYGKIKTVAAKSFLAELEEKLKIKKTNNYTTVVKNKIAYNFKTGKNYLSCFPTRKGTNSKSTYVVTDKLGEKITYDCLPDTYKDMVCNSYWSNKTFTEMFRVNVDNVISIC